MEHVSRYMGLNTLETAFIESFDAYGDAIFRFCLVKVSNVELAEDMTQETFTRYWQSLREGKEMTNTRSYLYTIANNLAKDWYKKKKSDSLDAKMESGFEPRDLQLSSPELNASYQEVLDSLEELEVEDREVLMLRHIDGLEPKDIAAILGGTPNAISVRLNRAMERLKKHLHAT